MDQATKKALQIYAAKIRLGIVDSTNSAKSGHPGGSLSSADVFAYLYGKEMRVDPKNPKWADRDRFVLSKGHCAPGLYSALAYKGFFPPEDLTTLRHIGSYLQGHPNMNTVPGVDMSTGSYGTAGTQNVTYTVQDRTISGTVTQALAPGEGLTLRLILPDGYFKFDNTKYNLTIAMIAVLPALAALIVLVLFLKFGRDKRYAPTVEFYPPEGLNSAEVGLWYKGKATNEMVLSLLVYLAQRNHIAIHPGKRKRDFVLTKCHGYVGQDTNLAVFMDGLFPDGRTRTDNKQLKNHFYETVGTIRADLNSTESRSRFFDKTSIYLKLLSFVLLALSAAGGAYFSHRALGDSLTLAPSILYAMLAGTLCLALGLIPACCMLRRTDEGAKTLAQIQGFRSFLVTAEKEKLETLVEQDPEYFYHILPYTYALGVSDKWIKKFESIAMQPPRWYNGTDVWSYVLFDRMLRDTLRAANDSMVSQPGGKAGSFVSGGGGFTGGGVGGGGGGSW